MKKTLSLISISLLIFASACKLDKPVFPDDSPRSDSYQPVSKGTFWKFNNITSGITLTQTSTMTGATETINGKLYYAANAVSGSQNDIFYYYHGDGKYAMRSTSFINGITIEFPYLIDNMTVGQKWTMPASDSGTINGAPAQFVGEIMEYGITKEVSGKTFTNVVHTKLQLQYNLTGTMQTWQIYDFYIAKGVGWILMETATFGINSTSSISSYSIK